MHYVHDLFFSPHNQTLWVAVQAIGAAFAAIGTVAAFFVILCQVRKAQAQIGVMREQTQALQTTTGFDLLFRLDERFESGWMRRRRRLAAETLIRAINPPEKEEWNADTGPRVERVLDFFELLGLLVRKGGTQAEDVWSLFSRPVVNYYLACKEAGFFDEWLDDPTHYDDFRRLYGQMQQISRQHRGEEDQFDTQFLLEEYRVAAES